MCQTKHKAATGEGSPPPPDSGKGSYVHVITILSGLNTKQQVQLTIPDVEEFHSSTRLFCLLNILLVLLEIRQIKVLLVQGGKEIWKRNPTGKQSALHPHCLPIYIYLKSYKLLVVVQGQSVINLLASHTLTAPQSACLIISFISGNYEIAFFLLPYT